jgi:uncharacterized protein YhbP (UPF0306 family)
MADESNEIGGSDEVLAFLADHHVLSLATTVAGEVHAASLMYAHKGMTLYWVSDPDARHSQEIEANPRVAATIAKDYTDFAQIEGLQIKGTVRRIGGMAERLKAVQLLSKRYSFLKSFLGEGAALAKHMSKAAVYELTPSEITLIDNKKGFGHKDRFEFLE